MFYFRFLIKKVFFPNSLIRYYYFETAAADSEEDSFKAWKAKNTIAGTVFI